MPKIETLTESPIITRNDLYGLWQESKNVKGLKAWFSYMMHYDRYKRLANFGANVINKYQVPYGTPRLLWEKDKE